MASAMYTDVKRKEDRSTFIRPHEGLFGLREWLEEGVDFKVPDWVNFRFLGPARLPPPLHCICSVVATVLGHAPRALMMDAAYVPGI